MTFNKDDLIKSLLNYPLLKDLQKWLKPVSSSFADLSEEDILNSTFDVIAKRTTTWDIELLMKSINTLIDNISKGIQVDHMIYNNEEINKDPGKAAAGLLFYPGDENSPFVCIVPGGGYSRISTLHEGICIAQTLNDQGYSAFVLLYRVEEESFPKPMEDIARAIAYILENSQQLKVCKEQYSVIGFSAGGHLAASFGTKSLGYAKYQLPKPEAIILAYPVITMGEYRHPGSRDMLLGDKPKQELILQTSVEEQIDEEYPRTYIWHCRHDRSVPWQNSQLLYDSLQKYKVESILRIYDCWFHGWGLAPKTSASQWFSEAISFWRQNFSH